MKNGETESNTECYLLDAISYTEAESRIKEEMAALLYSENSWLREYLKVAEFLWWSQSFLRIRKVGFRSRPSGRLIVHSMNNEF